jgi:type II secretory pathway pseudopilin PulG
LIEILVVMIIIGMLVAMLLPAVQKVREAARRSNCGANMHQIGIAMANYESTHGYFPASWNPVAPNTNGNIDGWSAWALLLPYVEHDNLYSQLNFDLGYDNAPVVTTADGSSIKVNALRVPSYICPSEVRDEAKFDDGLQNGATDYPLNYALSLGPWFIYNPATGEGGPGAFCPNRHFKSAEYRDGMSFTMCASEVKAWQPNLSDASLAGSLKIPVNAADVTGFGGTFNVASGHTEWADGRSTHAGFTTTFKPNAVVPYTDSSSGTTYDVDWINQREGTSKNRTTYAAITARSYHEGIVNTVMMDASVRSFANDIDVGVWRAFSTRNGREVIPSKYQTQ